MMALASPPAQASQPEAMKDDHDVVIIRTSHAAPDQSHGRGDAWSVHGGDAFAGLFGNNKSEKSSSKGRKVSFSEADDTVTVSPMLSAPSIRRKRELPTPPAGATAEAVLLTRPDGENSELGFECDSENVVLSVSPPRSEVQNFQHGTLRPGDRIVAINGVTLGPGQCVPDLVPAGKTFTHFDIARCAEGGVETPRARASDDMTKRSKSGLFSSSKLRRNTFSLNDLREFDSEDGEYGTLPLVVAASEALRVRFDEQNRVVAWDQHEIPTGGPGHFVLSGLSVNSSPIGGPTASTIGLPTPSPTASTPTASPPASSPLSSPRPAHCTSRLALGDQIVAIDGAAIREGQACRDVLGQLHADHLARRGGLSTSPAPRGMFLFTVRRLKLTQLPAAADGPKRSMVGQKIHSTLYSMRRSMDVSRTTLCTAGREHRLAQELAADVGNLALG